jgi:hypothetical protein
MPSFTETVATSTATWTSPVEVSTTWARANVDVVRRFGVKKFGIGPFGQGFTPASTATFTEVE